MQLLKKYSFTNYFDFNLLDVLKQGEQNHNPKK